MYIVLLLAFDVIASFADHVTTVNGVIWHGFNSFNNELVYDFSSISSRFGGSASGCFIATLKDENDAAPSSSITAQTDRHHILATCPAVRGAPTKFLSIPVMNVGTLDSASTDHTDRFPVAPFDEATNIGDFRISKDGIFRPTLADYEKIRGSLQINCNKKTSISELYFKISNGIPKMLYTVWEIDLFDPLTGTDTESADGLPPSLPNVLITDKNGDGELTMHVPYCPYNSCKTQQKCDDNHNGVCPDCTIMYILAIHWDYTVNGGTSGWEGTELRMPGGVITSWQMGFAVNSNAKLLNCAARGSTHKTQKNKAMFDSKSGDNLHLALNSNNNMDHNLMVSLSASSLGNLWSIAILFVLVQICLFWCSLRKNSKVLSMENKYEKTDIDESEF